MEISHEVSFSESTNGNHNIDITLEYPKASEARGGAALMNPLWKEDKEMIVIKKKRYRKSWKNQIP